ncbi:hypothetical protein BJV74DRAFT_988371 [Russula compacta]|nr:hypothetical protein BJV74DRAFT_988371 [Russula compacta]
MPTVKTLDQDYQDSVLTRYVGVIAFTVLVWDHVVTFSDEVEYIWKGRKGPVADSLLQQSTSSSCHLTYMTIRNNLRPQNRYLIPLGFIVNLWAYFRKTWTLHRCGHFVRYEGSMTMIGVTVVALMMFLRVRALYSQSLLVQFFVLVILFTFIGLNSWLLTHGIPVPHPAYPLVDSCTMIVDPKISGPLASSSAWLPLVYDTAVIFLTLIGTAKHRNSKDTGQMFRAMFKEGLVYYSVICTITLVFTMMVVFAEPSVRNITGQVQLCLTVAMMSRITIHLKRSARYPNAIPLDDANHRPFIRQPSRDDRDAHLRDACGAILAERHVTASDPQFRTHIVGERVGSYFAMEAFLTMT